MGGGEEITFFFIYISTGITLFTLSLGFVSSYMFWIAEGFGFGFGFRFWPFVIFLFHVLALSKKR